MTIQVAITLLLIFLAFWRRDIILYLAVVPLSSMTAFRWYELNPDEQGLVVTGVFVLIAIYSFYKVVENLIERIRA